MKYALIIDDEVRELFDQPPVFHPSLEIAEVDDSVEVYFIREGDGYVKPPIVPPAQPEDQRPSLAELRALFDRVARLEAKLGTDQ